MKNKRLKLSFEHCSITIGRTIAYKAVDTCSLFGFLKCLCSYNDCKENPSHLLFKGVENLTFYSLPCSIAVHLFLNIRDGYQQAIKLEALCLYFDGCNPVALSASVDGHSVLVYPFKDIIWDFAPIRQFDVNYNPLPF